MPPSVVYITKVMKPLLTAASILSDVVNMVYRVYYWVYYWEPYMAYEELGVLLG
jgi:hypothetical protein